MMKTIRILFFLALSLWASFAVGLGRYNGIAQRGNGTAVKNLFGTSINVSKALPGATITVKIAGSSTNATIYSTESGTAKSNPFSANSDASFFFYAAAGCYDLTYASGSDTFTVSSECISDTSVDTTVATTIASYAATAAERAVVGNGSSKPLSTYYATQALAEAAYEEAFANWGSVPLTTELDTVVIQEAVLEIEILGGGLLTDGRGGKYIISREINWQASVRFQGDSVIGTEFETTGTTGFIVIDIDDTENETNVVMSDFQLDMGSFADRTSTVPDNTVVGIRVNKNINRFYRIRLLTVPHGGQGILLGGYANTVRDCFITGTAKNSGGSTNHAIGIDVNSSAVSGANATVIDGVGFGDFPGVLHATNDSGGAIRIASGASNGTDGVNILSCWVDNSDIAVFLRAISGVGGPSGILIQGLRSEANEVAVLMQDNPFGVRIENCNFGTLSATGQYHVINYGTTLSMAGNFFGLAASSGASVVAGYRRAPGATGARADAMIGSTRVGAKPFISDGNTGRATMYVDTNSNSSQATLGADYSAVNSSMIGIRVPRYSTSTSAASTTGLSHTTAAYAITGTEFGATGSLAVDSANDSAGRITITANGGGCSATPTVTLTFVLPYVSAPRAVIVQRGGATTHGTAAINFQPVTTAITTTTAVIDILDVTGAAATLPCAGETIALQFWIVE